MNRKLAGATRLSHHEWQWGCWTIVRVDYGPDIAPLYLGLDTETAPRYLLDDPMRPKHADRLRDLVCELATAGPDPMTANAP